MVKAIEINGSEILAITSEDNIKVDFDIQGFKYRHRNKYVKDISFTGREINTDINVFQRLNGFTVQNVRGRDVEVALLLRYIEAEKLIIRATNKETLLYLVNQRNIKFYIYISAELYNTLDYKYFMNDKLVYAGHSTIISLDTYTITPGYRLADWPIKVILTPCENVFEKLSDISISYSYLQYACIEGEDDFHFINIIKYMRVPHVCICANKIANLELYLENKYIISLTVKTFRYDNFGENEKYTLLKNRTIQYLDMPFVSNETQEYIHGILVRNQELANSIFHFEFDS